MSATVGREVAAAGDEVARLYDQHAAKLRRFCAGRLRSAEDADDAVQTVFLRAYTALRGGTAPVYEAAWLYKIAHNVCLSRLESGAARRRVEEPRDLDALHDLLAAPGERRDELVGLADALAAMPPNLRQAILLREWQGLSYAEIAEALGVSVSAVETLIFRARRHLAAALERGAGTARSAATLLQLPWLLRRLRSLLASGRGAELGVAKLSAVAVLATAGVGAGVATSVVGASRPPATSTVSAPGASRLTATSAPRRPETAPVRRVAAQAERTVARARPAAPATLAPAVPLALPVAALAPVTDAAATATVAPPATAPAAVTRAPAPVPATTVAAPPTPTPPAAPAPTAAALPTTTVPALPPVTVAAPTATVPVPTVPLPVPTVSVAVPTLPETTTSPPAVAATVPAVTATTPVTTVTVTTTVTAPALP
jgi:RNA polymerase sigma factor (sigma-70 family)